ncbi:NAD(P)H oxidoreductase [Candidatus Symbiopectobacterium sp. NZEC135]|uniref:NAD(P)H oxidoreductase n=1 Tax=Candidatus Symbiopectobacterium sp. NZEC135 TaxID=2820471 RepID=UPI0022263FEB|nr:NAD(P)H oxidoreductase [Candidatus Symbiopectobacterium sp. NZEC135]MCW2480524.1 NAD(P)H oxidoreductase [Candidatus Symbiopectobacterium sp. NZEC135]
MKKNNMYIIWSHPRRDSLTAQVVQEIQEEAVGQGFNVSTLDLYRSGFDPVLREDDEPDWNNPQKTYSPEVHRLFGELEDKDTLVLVFPVWWYGFPAMLKGYLERVWNYGLAYGEDNALKHKKIRWLALVGGSQAGFIKFGWEKNMTDYIKGGMGYLGVEDVEIDFLYNTIGVEEGIDDREGHYQQLFAQARGIVNSVVE